MSLQYKTRGGSSPQGKPRVYFCCHNEDFERSFTGISDEILALQNCAFWYKESADAVTEELLSDLRQMQLFVMPVTTKLLCTENDALQVEFAFAIQNHIPVLPLMQEPGLETLFNQKCGDLQFLDKYQRDDTALSYEEKLKNYLEAVLIGDELAEKIRAAFDAYVFLSYRKKDRKYAQELMHLIHKKAFCRDIAIWYDEFLTPGENFNESIRSALQKSRLFVLAVTPNLVNEENYIMTTEYPMAREEGKPILPAELVPTDRELLARKYRDIPACTNAYDEAALTEVLMTVVKDIAIQENDNDPQHNFFIGLAYLGGVDVEVDHQKALALITFAAEADLPEAMEKLVSMYRSGVGVHRDYGKAIDWQRRLAEHYEKICAGEGTEQSYERYLRALRDWGDYWYELRKLSNARSAYEKMLAACQEANSKYDFRRSLSVSYYKIGHMAENQGDLPQAQAYYHESLALREMLKQETGTVESRRDLAACYGKLGGVAEKRGKLALAQEYYQKDFALSETLAGETGTVETKRDLSIGYCELGNIATKQGDLARAQECYQKSLALIEIVAEETGMAQSKRDLLVTYDLLGRTAERRGDLTRAQEYYQKVLLLREALAKETETVQSQRDLSISYNNLGGIAEKQGDLARAQEYYQKGLLLSEALAKETETVQSQRDLLISYNHLGRMMEKQGNLLRAQEYYQKGLLLSEALAEKVGTVESQRDLSVSYNQLGRMAEKQGNLLRAQEYYQKGLLLSEALAEKVGTVESQRDLSVSYNLLGRMAEKRGDLTRAQEYYQKGLLLSEALAKKTGTAQAYDDLAYSYYILGRAGKNKADYQKAYDIWHALMEKYPENSVYRSYVNMITRILRQ